MFNSKAIAVAATSALLTLAPGAALWQHTGAAHPSHVASRVQPASAGDRSVVVVKGAVDHVLRLTNRRLRGYPLVGERVTYQSMSGTETHRFRGPLLYDVLESAGPRFDPSIKNDQLRFAVLVGASDDYAAAVSWGEFDPSFGAKKILLAVSEDGQPLAQPRLVVPGDIAGGRYVYDVISVQLRDLG